jgi:hypothetical protein
MPTMQDTLVTTRTFVMATLGLAWQAARRVLHRLWDHPFAIDSLDASAETLWPGNPEEPDPPRWQLGALPAASGAPIVEPELRCPCPCPPQRRMVRLGS